MLTLTADISDGAWEVYINGKKEGSGSSGLPSNSYYDIPWFSLGETTESTESDDHHPIFGKVDEARLYNKELSTQEVEKLYLEGRPFVGNYSRSLKEGLNTELERIEIDSSSIPTDTDVDAVFKAKDSSDNIVDEQVIDLQEGQINYSLDVADSEKAEVVFNGSSSDVTKSWEINGFKVYAGFCDFRGPKNECVMNSTRQLEPQTYDVDSIFESRGTAVFEAFSGTSILNISNSSRLSGTWKGSFDIRSNPVTIEPGATFIPGNGGIVVGE